MSSPKLVWEDWPVIIVGRGIEDSNQLVNEEFFDVLREALERDGHFGIVVDKSKIDPEVDAPRSEAEIEGIRWLKIVRDRIAQQCVGVVYVLSEEALNSERVRRAGESGLKVYGCPTTAFTNHEDARQWLTEALVGNARSDECGEELHS